jgi:TetR/AcrR family transcriptional regulator, mexJK operon transcriptional repressor
LISAAKATRSRRGKAATRGGSLGGRPSRAQSEKLGGRILDAATSLFLTHGYGATSIEEVARHARVSKRTFYHRFEDKAALFGAVVHRIVERLRPPADIPIVEGADLAAILRRLAEIILHAALSPQAIALHRLIVGESARFPKLASVANANGAAEEAVDLIAKLLARESQTGRIALDDPPFAARQFLHMVVAIPQRRAMGLGAPMSAGELRDWPRDVATLFLEGCRWRPRAATRKSAR